MLISRSNDYVPNFFILGAPKSGTTALAHYLRSHQEIVVSKPKEPHYFSTDLSDTLRICKTADAYRRCFGEVTDKQITGEASVLYLYSQDAVPNILKVKPKAKFIVMLRNPVEMARSLHLQNLVSGIETEKDFEIAWRLQKERAMKKGEGSELLQYGDICKIGNQIERLLQLADRNQVLIILFDNFSNNTQMVYENVLNFLGVSQDGRREFPKMKGSRRHRSLWLHKFLKSLHEWASPLRRILAWLRIRNAGSFLTRVRRWNSPSTKPQVISSVFEEELYEYFKKDIEIVENLCGGDLTWSKNRCKKPFNSHHERKESLGK